MSVGSRHPSSRSEAGYPGTLREAKIGDGPEPHPRRGRVCAGTQAEPGRAG